MLIRPDQSDGDKLGRNRANIYDNDITNLHNWEGEVTWSTFPIVRPFPRNFKAKYNKCWSQEHDDLNHILFSYIHASWCIHFAMSSHLQPPCKSNQPTYHSLAVKILVVFLRVSISSLHPLQPKSMTSATPTNFSILSMTVVMCRGVQMGSPATKTGPKQHWKVLWLSRSWPEGAGGQPQQCPLRYNKSQTSSNGFRGGQQISLLLCKQPCSHGTDSAAEEMSLIQNLIKVGQDFTKNILKFGASCYHRILERKQCWITYHFMMAPDEIAGKRIDKHTVLQPWNWLCRREEVLHTAVHRK